MSLTDAERERQRRWYAANRDRVLEQNRRYRDQRAPGAAAAAKRRTTYGLEPGAFDALVLAQGGRCAICRQPPPGEAWVVDHDHDCCPGRKSCGRCIRGLLCQPCNLGLGCLGENWETLLAGAFYLMESDERRLTRAPDDVLFDRDLRVALDG